MAESYLGWPQLATLLGAVLYLTTALFYVLRLVRPPPQNIIFCLLLILLIVFIYAHCAELFRGQVRWSTCTLYMYLHLSYTSDYRCISILLLCFVTQRLFMYMFWYTLHTCIPRKYMYRIIVRLHEKLQTCMLWFIMVSPRTRLFMPYLL